jgi:hypothetical protein
MSTIPLRIPLWYRHSSLDALVQTLPLVIEVGSDQDIYDFVCNVASSEI